MHRAKVILWFGDVPDQLTLAHKMADRFEVIGIVVQSKRGQKRKINFQLLFEKAFEKVFLRSIGGAWVGMQEYFRNKHSTNFCCDVLNVEDINDKRVHQFTADRNPDIILVSGTNLVKSHLIESFTGKSKILNLHTGLSPYIKGGPNCTNWCLSIGKPHLIGNTIMWLDAGIDSGNIISTQLVVLQANESLLDLHIRVIENAHQLYIDCVRLLEQHPNEMPNIKQEDLKVESITFYNKMWGLKEKINLVRNFKRMGVTYLSNQYSNAVKEVKTIDLPILTDKTH